jgi:hypothetical protein
MWHHISEDSNPHSSHLENFKSQIGYYFSQYVAHALTLSDPMSDKVRHYDFPVPNAFPHVVQTLANR